MAEDATLSNLRDGVHLCVTILVIVGHSQHILGHSPTVEASNQNVDSIFLVKVLLSCTMFLPPILGFHLCIGSTTCLSP